MKRTVADYIISLSKNGISLAKAIKIFQKTLAEGELPEEVSMAFFSAWERQPKTTVEADTIRRWIREVYPEYHLSRRQEALAALASGRAVREVAAEIHVSERTIRNWKKAS